MKIAVTTSGNTLDSPLDQRFGRAAKFLIYDLDTDNFQVVDNQQNLNLSGGAGIQSGQNIAKAGVEAVITGHVGPKMAELLKKLLVILRIIN